MPLSSGHLVRNAFIGADLELVGADTLRWRLGVRAYASAFSLAEGTAAEAWDEDLAKCLTIHYFWDISGDQLGPAVWRTVCCCGLSGHADVVSVTS